MEDSVIVDSDIIIEWLRGKEDLPSKAEISVVTAFEILCGTRYLENKREIAATETIFASLPIHPFTISTADIAANIWANLKKNGRKIGSRDLFIAATAVEQQKRLLTRNHKHFRDIEGLTLQP